MNNVVVFLFVILISNAVQAITGFAGTLIAMPPSMMLIGVDEAKVVLNLIAVITCAVIALSNKRDIRKDILKKVILYMGIGMIVGIVIYKVVQIEYLLYLYGIMIILLSIKKMFFNKEVKLENSGVIIILIIAGVIHGMFVSGGALLVVYMVNALKNKSEFRATMASVWVILGIILTVNQGYSGLINMNLIYLTAIALIPAVIGVYFGNKLHGKISKEMFMKLTYILLFLSGAAIFV